MKFGACLAMALVAGFAMARLGFNDWLVAGIVLLFAVAAFMPEFVDGLSRS